MVKIKLWIQILIWMRITQTMVIQNVCIKVSILNETSIHKPQHRPVWVNQFLVRAKTTADKIVILLWTWPSRSAADNSIRNKILSYRAVIEDDEDDEDEEDSEEDYDFDMD